MTEPATPEREGPPTGLSIADRLSLPRIHWAWLLFIAGFAALFWASRAIIGPFVAGFILAYLLDPFTHWLQNRGLPRWLGALIALIVFVIAFVAIILATAPIVRAMSLVGRTRSSIRVLSESTCWAQAPCAPGTPDCSTLSR